MSEIIEKQINAYRENFLQYGASPKGTFQNNMQTQYERFSQLLLPFTPFLNDNFSICDVGSGISDLYAYMSTQVELQFQYTGIEIVDEMVNMARSRFPEIDVHNLDLLSPKYQQKFDFLVLSGVFNLPGQIPRFKWEKFVFELVEKMFHLSNIGIAFNGLTTYSTFNSPELFYINPALMLEFIQTKLTRHCELRMSSPLYEVTYSLFKPDAIKLKFPNKEFAKYF